MERAQLRALVAAAIYDPTGNITVAEATAYAEDIIDLTEEQEARSVRDRTGRREAYRALTAEQVGQAIEVPAHFFITGQALHDAALDAGLTPDAAAWLTGSKGARLILLVDRNSGRVLGARHAGGWPFVVNPEQEVEDGIV